MPLNRIPRTPPERLFTVTQPFVYLLSPRLADDWLAVAGEEKEGVFSLLGFDFDGTRLFRLALPTPRGSGPSQFPLSGLVGSPEGVWIACLKPGRVVLHSITRAGAIARSVELGPVAPGGVAMFGRSCIFPSSDGVVFTWTDGVVIEGRTIGGASLMVAARSDGSADLWNDEPAMVLDVSGDALLLAKPEGSQACVVEERGATDGRVRWRQRFTCQHVGGLLGPHVAVLFVGLTDIDARMPRIRRSDGAVLVESQIRLPIGADVPPRFQLVAADEMQLLLRMKNTLFAESILEPSARPWSVNLGSELAFDKGMTHALSRRMQPRKRDASGAASSRTSAREAFRISAHDYEVAGRASVKFPRASS